MKSFMRGCTAVLAFASLTAWPTAALSLEPQLMPEVGTPDLPASGEDADEGMPAGSGGSGEVGIMATCSGCTAYNSMGWTDYGAWESVHVNYTKNTASEVIDQQMVHVALVSNTESVCYEGTLRFSDSTGYLDFYTNSPVLSSGDYTAFNDTWTQASGHDWWDELAHWEINEENDRCRTF